MSNFFEDVHNRESRKLFQKKALVDVHCHWLSKSLVKLGTYHTWPIMYTSFLQIGLNWRTPLIH